MRELLNKLWIWFKNPNPDIILIKLWRKKRDRDILIKGIEAKRQVEEYRQKVEKQAYLLWEADGRHEGRDEYYWRLAVDKVKGKNLFTLYKPYYLLEKRVLEPIDVWISKQAFFTIAAQIAILAAIIAFIGSEQMRRNNEVFTAWQTITSAHDQPGSGGRIRALEFLNSRPLRFPWIWVTIDLFGDEKECKRKLVFGRRWKREPLAGLSTPKAYLAKINLCGADLENANLQNAELWLANFQQADLSEANLQYASLFEANLQDASLWKANLQEASLYKANLQEASLYKANLQDADLGGANLQDADLGKANLQNAYLRGANLQNAELYKANLQDAELWGTNLQDAGSYIFGPSVGANLQNANLELANLQNADLRVANLSGANLQGADLRGVNLQNAELYKANLQDAELRGTNLQDAELREANFQNADLRVANLSGANLQGADLRGANLQDANLYKANLQEAIFIETENLTPKQIKSACFWNRAIYKGKWNKKEQTYVAIESENTNYIEKLKNDLASDPKYPPDCSEWRKEN